MSEAYKLKLIDDSNFNISLGKVRFDRLGIPEDLPDGVEFKLRTKDNYKILKITSNKVDIEFTREKYFEPAGLFKIEIVIIVGYKLKSSKSSEREKIIEEDLKNQYLKLLSPAATRASILVSALTDVDWRKPIVDPPYPLLK
ncbi:MAG TPA: hypothetical protein DCK79_09345 [Candidatus Atribacteria bacterium]|jgi:hypothetical protein|nr:hypothetical protein [Candidatus Atribacteria bacterium]